jgi:sporulation protein YlmC with PRC-barrel domain
VAPSRKRRKIHLSQSQKPPSQNHQHHLRPLSLSRQCPKPPSLCHRRLRALTWPGDSVSVTEYHKQNVYDTSDNAIGEISDVLLDKDGHVTAVILSVGGLLGLGAKYVSVPFDALRVTEKEGKRYLVIDATKEALTSAPGYQYDRATAKWVPEAKG